MTPLQERIVSHMFEHPRAMSLSSITVAMNESQNKVDTALRTLRQQGTIVLTGHSKYRLESATKTRMGEEAKRLQRERGEKRSDENAPGQQDRTQRLAGIQEPTDADLDAIEAEEEEVDLLPVLAELREKWSTTEAKDMLADVCRCEFTEVEPEETHASIEADGNAVTGSLLPEVDLVPAEPENSAPRDSSSLSEHIWGPVRSRATQGLRIEAVAKELVEVERRRAELLEELRGLVG